MLTVQDIQFHRGAPLTPLDTETLTGFATVMSARSVSRRHIAEPGAMEWNENELRQDIFNRVYGEISTDLRALLMQLSDAQRKIDKDPLDGFHEFEQLIKSVRLIESKTRPA